MQLGRWNHCKLTQITRRQIITTIKSILVTAPENIRPHYTSMTTAAMITALTHSRISGDIADPSVGALTVLKTLAVTYQCLPSKTIQIQQQIDQLFEITNPHAKDVFGYQTIAAADLIVSVGENSERIRSQVSTYTAIPAPMSVPMNYHNMNEFTNRATSTTKTSSKNTSHSIGHHSRLLFESDVDHFSPCELLAIR